MTISTIIETGSAIYKVITVPTLSSICLITGNQFIMVDISTGHRVTHTIHELSVILDLAYENGLIYLAGIGHEPLVYNLAEKRVIATIGTKQESNTAYSAITLTDDIIYCANLYTEKLEIYQHNSLIHAFKTGAFVKQLTYLPHSRTLIIAIAESEDSGYLLFYHPDLHCLDVYVDCHFAVSSIALSPDQTTLLITGGYPPLSIQVHTYPDLLVQKELMLTQDYNKDLFGTDPGFAFNLQWQWVGPDECLFPYPDGCILLINYKTNTCTPVLQTNDTWLYIQLIAGTLVAVTAEGNIYLFDHTFTTPAHTISTTGPAAVYTPIDCDQPLSKRFTIEAPEDLEDLDFKII